MYMLDTDTVSYLIRGKNPKLDKRVAAIHPEQLCISSVTRGELLYGLHLKNKATRLGQLVGQFLACVQSLAWDNAAADHFGKLAAKLTLAGTPIGTMDTMIASHALANNAILVSNNKKHFAKVEGLTIENWLR